MIRIEIEVEETAQNKVSVLCRSFEGSFTETKKSEKDFANRVNGALRFAIGCVAKTFGDVKEFESEDVAKVRGEE